MILCERTAARPFPWQGAAPATKDYRGYNRALIMPLAPGTRLGPYEISAPLGAGGMGEVYRALDTRLEPNRPIKIFAGAASSDPVTQTALRAGSEDCLQPESPHICVLHDVGSQDGISYLVMECVEGETLAKRLEKGALPLEQVLNTECKLPTRWTKRIAAVWCIAT